MWRLYVVVSLALFCIVTLHEINLCTGAKPPQRMKIKPKEYNVKKFNGTIILEFENRLSTIQVGKNIKSFTFRIGTDKRIRFNLVERKGKRRAFMTVRKYKGKLILRAGDQRIEVKSPFDENNGPDEHHIGVIYDD